jgi:signal transduction histidine kinase
MGFAPSLLHHPAEPHERAGTARVASRSEAACAADERVVAAVAESRRRIQRDLHDGAQRWLVHTTIALRRAAAELRDSDGPGAALVMEALAYAERANADLRELVRGVMPCALTRGGLRTAIDSLVEDLAIPVRVEVLADRLPTPIETTAYFVVAEALANAVKHAGPASARVSAVVHDGALHVRVADDGAGGADPTRGSGLAGLADRVAARGGTISITSAPGAGTTIDAVLPIRGGCIATG